MALVDSLGVRQILRSRAVRYTAGTGGVPERFTLIAAREGDTLTLSTRILDHQATRMTAGGMGRTFLQMRGEFTLDGSVGGIAVADSGVGFFETYVP